MLKKKLGVVLASLAMVALGLGAVEGASPSANAAVIQGWCDTATPYGNGRYIYMVPTLGWAGTPACQMSQGSVSRGVEALQAGLSCNSVSPGAVDGNWGPNTTTAVRAFQQLKGIAVDGVYGPQTHNAMRVWGGLNPGSCRVAIYSPYL
ncbi:MAG: peptidoglycan-binding protein [Propionibacteriaceae bacterium]|jgi:peptidoglycan hydrolase-like protein with peptidoglycan-binding domain|nr:peptidoglycan-binding protein [Propionibacteriaceae bacterium]